MKFRMKHPLLTLTSTFIVLSIVVPIGLVFVQVFEQPSANWETIQRYLLKEYTISTLQLLLFTGVVALLIGVGLAWLVTAFEFPGRSFFTGALILPLAIPPYIAGFAYYGLTNYTSLWQTWLRDEFGIAFTKQWTSEFPLTFAVFVFALMLYPYIYTLVRSFLSRQSADLIETARVLGRSPANLFVTTIFPLSRIPIVAGVSLVSLEVLNDYGLVNFVGIQTYSVAIFQTWRGMGDLASALRIAIIFIALIVLILLVEKILRGRRSFASSTTKLRPLTPIKLRGWQALGATLGCSLVFALGFVLPVAQLLYWASLTYRDVIDLAFWYAIINTLLVAFLAAFTILFGSIVVANFGRLHNSWTAKAYSRLTVIGYSIPGAVIAIAVLSAFLSVGSLLGISLQATIGMLLFAYMLRFLSIGYSSIEAGYEKIGVRYLEASRTLGFSVFRSFWTLELRMLRPALLGGFALLFIDIVKELPLTLFLRPFNFETLSTTAYTYAANEQVQQAAWPALLMIGASSLLILVLSKFMREEVK